MYAHRQHDCSVRSAAASWPASQLMVCSRAVLDHDALLHYAPHPGAVCRSCVLHFNARAPRYYGGVCGGDSFRAVLSVEDRDE